MADIRFQDLVSTIPLGTDIVPIGQGATSTRKSTISDIRGVVNDLTTGGVDKTLSAEMGKQLNTDKAEQTALNTTNTNVSNLTTEITNARGGEVNLDTRMDKVDSKIGDIAVYNATCTYSNPNFTLILTNAPTTLPDFFTIRTKMPNAWVDGSSIEIGAKIYTTTNVSFENGDVVIINFDEVANKCFFKSGGVGANETLPQQVDTFTATGGDAQITFTWTLKGSIALSGFYLTYKLGNATPTRPDDGTKIDITDIATTSRIVTGLVNGSQYTAMIFPYNSKKQVQTIPISANATPLSNIIISSLTIGSKLSADGKNFIIVDKNHSGYPSNSVTLMLETVTENMAFDANGNSYQSSAIRTFLNNTFFDSLTTLKNKIISTTISALNNSGTTESMVDNIFLPSMYEYGMTAQYVIADGSKIQYFNDHNVYDGINTIMSRSAGPSYTEWMVTSTGGYTNFSKTSTLPVARPLFNINGDTILNLTPNAQGYYSLI